MTSSGDPAARVWLAATAIGATAMHAQRTRCAYEEQVFIGRQLAATAGRLAAEIEQRLTARRQPETAEPQR